MATFTDRTAALDYAAKVSGAQQVISSIINYFNGRIDKNKLASDIQLHLTNSRMQITEEQVAVTRIGFRIQAINIGGKTTFTIC